MPCRRSAAAGPMPESISSCGDAIVPPATMTSRAAAVILDTRRSPAVDVNARHERVGHHLQVRPAPRRCEVRVRGAAAPPGALDELYLRCTVERGTVRVGVLGDTGLGTGSKEG